MIHTGHHPIGGIIHPGTDGLGDTAGPIPMHGGIRGLMDTVDTGFIPITAGFIGILITLIMIPTGSIMMDTMETILIGFEVEHHQEKGRHTV